MASAFPALPSLRRLACALALSTCVLAAAAVTPASAATVLSIGSGSMFADISSEVNTVTVGQDLAGHVVITDTTTPPVDGDGAGTGCEVAGNVATCPVPGLPFPGLPLITITAGGGNDTVVLLDSLVSPTKVDGGGGDDALTGGPSTTSSRAVSAPTR